MGSGASINADGQFVRGTDSVDSSNFEAGEEKSSNEVGLLGWPLRKESAVYGKWCDRIVGFRYLDCIYR